MDTATLMQGREVTVTLADGTTTSVKVRQLPVSEYEKAFAHWDDEIGMVAHICGKSKDWAGTVSPESYETLLIDCGAVNEKGFFAFARRRADRQERLLATRLSSMKPEVVSAAIAKASSHFVPGLQPK